LNLLIKKFKQNQSKIVYCILFLYFLAGLLTFKDYGVSIDEKFQRLSGLHWLEYLLSFTNLSSLQNIVKLKISSVVDYTLPIFSQNMKYSVFFDVPAALVEIIFKIEESKKYFEIRHFLNFFIFFLSSIFFYKILNNRFSNENVSLIGLVFYILSPKIYGASFYNNKDIIFLSVLVISIYYFFKAIDRLEYKNIILLSSTLAIATTFRIVGILFPLLFVIFYFFSIISKKGDLVFLPKIIFFTFCYFFFLYIFWPHLWISPIENFVSLFNVGEMLITMKIFFNGNYVNSNFLPNHYLVTWVAISTPVVHLLFFILGFFYCFRRFLLRFIKIEKNTESYDLWRGKNEKKDLLILISLITIPLYLIYSQTIINNSWRHLFFLNIFLVYFASYAVYIILLKFRNNRNKIYLNFFILIALIHVGTRMFFYHPYQSTYFNFLVSSEIKNNFEIDYIGLTGIKFLREILKKETDNNKKVSIAVGSFLPLHNSMDLLKESEKKRLIIYGNEYDKADYIYSNIISEVDKNVDKKYEIPNNFTHLYSFKIYGGKLYDVYKKKNK